MVKVKVRPRLLSKRNFDSSSRRATKSNQQTTQKFEMGDSKERLKKPNLFSGEFLILEPPTKSANDIKDYRVIRLENGLTALLISDPTPVESSEDETDDDDEEEMTDEDDDEESSSDDDEEVGENDEKRYSEVAGQKMAAAGLSVGVGSFSDPSEIPGLAHFLEHMVFMGSEKYPSENSFESFLKRRGGDSNAFTDCERTTFYLEVHKKHLFETLDRFAQFFISPLLLKSSVDREIEAVDSEFHSCIQSDSERLDQLIGSFARKGHPMGKFFWGNSTSLKAIPNEKGINVYSKLSDFRKHYYSANLMTLAVQAQESLDTLEKWVREIFSKVPSNGCKISFVNLNSPFDTPKFRRLYKVISVGSSHMLEITWAFASMADYYREKPLDYISFLIGHEGKGSLLSYLKRQVWALNLWTDDNSHGFQKNSTNTFFSFTIELTDNGLEHYFDVLSAIFSYIKMLKTVGIQERIYQEMQIACDNEFRWRDEVAAIDYVQQLSQNMQMYPSTDYITGQYCYFQFNEKLISEFLNKLVPENVNIIVSSKVFEAENICNQKEPWFRTQYTSSEIDPEWLYFWKNIDVYPDFFIPSPNHFLATDFSLKPEDANQSTMPIKILDNSQERVWYKQDSKFKVPKAILYILLTTPLVSASPLNSVLGDLFQVALQQNLKEDIYPAEVALLANNIEFIGKGMLICLGGYNQKLKDLLKTIIHHIANFDVTDSLFEAVKANTRKNFYNNYIKPHRLCSDIHRKLTYHRYFSPLEKVSALNEITKDMLLTFVKDFKSNLFIESLCQGNLTADEALDICSIVKINLNCNELNKELVLNRTKKIPLGKTYCRVAGLNSDDGKSVIINYYQLGPATIHTACLMELLIAFMEEPCFDYLRTREQLGYNVFCAYDLRFGIIGFHVNVHTSVDKFSCSEVDDKIEEFLTYFRQHLNEITENEFKIQVSSLIKAKRQPDLHLQEEISRNSLEIINGEFVFDRIEKEIQCLEVITFDELKEWFCQGKTDGSNFSKLSIQVEGNGKSSKEPRNLQDNVTPKLLHLNIEKKGDGDFNVVMDLESFKETLESYPLIKLTS